MLRVPVSEAMWSTWRRYCAALGISMGRAVAGLIAYELGALAGGDASSGVGLGVGFAGPTRCEGGSPRRPGTATR